MYRAVYLAFAVLFLLAPPHFSRAFALFEADGEPVIPTHLARPVAQARAQLAKGLGVPVESIQIIEAREATWPNDCLGLPPEGACSNEETRGLRISLRAFDRNYEYRADGKGRLRFAGPGAKPELPKTVEAARRELANSLKITVDRVEVVRIEGVVWNDTCLGLPAPELCAQRRTPGYRIVFRAAGKEFRYHSDHDELIRFAGPGDTPKLEH